MQKVAVTRSSSVPISIPIHSHPSRQCLPFHSSSASFSMRLLLVSAFLWQLSLSDRRILKNYENKLNAREGEVVGGMVKRYRCIEEYVPIEEARDYDRQQQLLAAKRRRQKMDGNWRFDDPLEENATDFFHFPFKYVVEIKQRKDKLMVKEEEVETSLKVKPEEKSTDEEIEQMLHEDLTTPTTTTDSPIRPQIRRAPQHLNVFEHEKSRGEKVPISQLSPETGAKPRSRQFYVYDFDDEGETEYPEEDEYYEDRLSRRRQMRRRQYAQMRRNPYFYPKRFPYRPPVRAAAPSQYVQMQPIPLVQQLMQQQAQYPQQSYYAAKRQPLQPNLQPLPVVQAQPRPPQQQQSLFVRQPMATIAPPVVMEPAERVDPAVQNERRGHPQRPLHQKLNLKPLPRADFVAPATPAPAFVKGQLEEATPENCKKIISLSAQFGIKDIGNWSRSNCPTLQMFVPGATCQQLWHFIDSCHKRRFL